MKIVYNFVSKITSGKVFHYCIDLYIKFFLYFLWKRNNIDIGVGTKFLGCPIFSNDNEGVISIGENCLICSRSINTALGVSHPSIIRTLRNNSKIKIGSRVRMSGTSICSMSSIIIGDRCVIGSDVIISDTDFHSLDSRIRSSSADSYNSISKPIFIGNDCFIGARSIILKGVSLGNGVIVGAGSVVTNSFSDNSIIAGNPAKLIK